VTARFPIQQAKFWSLGRFVPKGRRTPNSIGNQFTEYVHEAATGCLFWGDRYRNAVPRPWGGREKDARRYETRSPRWHVFNYSPRDTVAEWHNDGVPGGYGTYLVIWCSANPTEFAQRPMHSDGTPMEHFVHSQVGQVYQPEPYEVVAVHNHNMLHRSPRMELEECEKRWFTRAYIAPSGKILDRPGVYAYEFT
jgi:hypothetical protein